MDDLDIQLTTAAECAAQMASAFERTRSSMGITNIEDAIRKHDFNYQNILTGVFSKDLQ